MEQLLNNDYFPYLVGLLIFIILMQFRSQRKLLKRLHELHYKVEDLTSEQKKTNIALQQRWKEEEHTPIENLQHTGIEVINNFLQKSQNLRELYPSIEKFIGEQLINKIGIGILIIGIGFFMKYAIDQAWLEAVGRIFFGIFSSIILLLIGFLLQKKYKSFSSVLIGGGFSIFYFTIGFSYQQYGLISKPLAFGLIALTTIFMAVISILYNRIQLGVIALIGGFITPIMVGGNSQNYLMLWSYLLMLNLGMLSVSIFKKWKIFFIVAYDCTIAMFGGWLYLFHDVYPYSKTVALIFGTIFYFIFFASIVIVNIRQKELFKAFDYLILLSANSFYFGLGVFLLDASYRGAFTISLAIVNALFLWVFYHRKDIDRNFIFLLISLILTYVSLAGPIQLEGNYITMFWACEVTILLWLSQRSGIKLIKDIAFLIFFLMVWSLAKDWHHLYFATHDKILSPILNAGFMTGLVVSISVTIFMNILQHEEKRTKVFGKILIHKIGIVTSLISALIIYLTIALELYYQIIHQIQEHRFWHIAHGIYAAIFILFLQLFAQSKKQKVMLNAANILGFIVIIYQATLVQSKVIELRDAYLVYESRASFYFLTHYVGVFFSMLILMNLIRYIQPMDTLSSRLYRALLWFSAILIVLTASIELDHCMVLFSYKSIETISEILTFSHRIGYPILWAICSLFLMIIGMKRQLKDLRMASLVLFVMAFVKLFVFDLQQINESERIIAFISLGCILLIISFMYQKLKRFWREQEEKEGL